MVAFRKRSNRRKTVIKKKSYKKKSNVKSTFTNRVKSVISRMAETKSSLMFRATNLVQYKSAGSAWLASIIPMTPYSTFLTISQGTGQGDRIGNSIRVKSLKLQGVLRPTPYNLTTNTDPQPFYVKLYFLTRKDSPSVISTTTNDVLQYGSSSQDFGTGLVNMGRPINTDEWTVHTMRTFKIGYSAYNGTSVDAAAQSYTNNDFKLNQFVNIDLTKYCTKIIKFDDNTTDPTSRNIVMYANIFYSDSKAAIASEIPCIFEYTVELKYDDM